MRKILFIICLTVLTCGVKQVDAQYIQSERRIMPKGIFDAQAAKEALGKGSATITGTAELKSYGYGRIPGSYIDVILFPNTPYFQEWAKLKKQENVSKGEIVGMDSLAFEHRLYCHTNKNGDFTFQDLKSGTYILYAIITWDRELKSGWNKGEIVTKRNVLLKRIEVKEGEKSKPIKFKVAAGV